MAGGGPRWRQFNVFLPAWTRRVSVVWASRWSRRCSRTFVSTRAPGGSASPRPTLIAWAKSLRAGTEDEIDHETWDAVVAEMRTRIEQRIDQCGHFRVGKISGVIIAR